MSSMRIHSVNEKKIAIDSLRYEREEMARTGVENGIENVIGFQIKRVLETGCPRM